MRRQGSFWRNALAGLLIGIGCVLPGVSGGVMAVSFGLYRPMLDAVLGIFHDTRRKLLFLAPLALGGAAGLLLGARCLGTAMRLYEKPMLCLFTGFILGGVPDLLAEAEAGGRFRRRWLGALAGGVLLALPMALLRAQGVERALSLTPLQALAVGLAEGVGTVVPGLSTSFLLMNLGWYQAYLDALAHPQAGVLGLVALGFAASALASMKAVQWLFDHARGYAYYAVLGFLLVSVALVFPGVGSGWTLWMQLAALLAGMLVARRMSGVGEPMPGTKE
ncbi:MAG TPA: DUF368 domain-containing protein [Candidatus Limiplasma pullistercoris]|nr:DUF368 domain-containing protein [Candidatus Limiplasma pullistercoris]